MAAPRQLEQRGGLFRLPNNPEERAKYIAANPHLRVLEVTGEAPASDSTPSVKSEERSFQEEGLSDSTDTEEDMSGKNDVVFTGKSRELEELILVCDLEFATNTKFEDEQAVQAAYFAKRFRGRALTWLVRKRQDTPEILQNYTSLLAAAKAAFGLSDEVKHATAAKQLPHIRQTTSVQTYIQTFDACADVLDIDDALKKVFFLKGLKQQVREALIPNDNTNRTFGWACQEAQRLDDELYSTRRGFGRGRQGGQGRGGRASGGARGTPGKCFSCGQFGHKQAACPTRQQY